MGNSSLQIGEIAALSGVSVDTVRYYEKLRLLPAAPRKSSGYRVFSPKAVEQIKFIKQAQELGFSLDEIKGLLKSGGAEECLQVRDLLERKVAEMDEQIKKMKAFRKTLAKHLSECSDEIDKKGRKAECPVLFEIGKE
jgi:DNA-binding transcriptional MerR regulator